MWGGHSCPPPLTLGSPTNPSTLDLEDRLAFDVDFEFSLEFQNSSPKRLVKLNFATDALEAHGQRVGRNCLGISAPASMAANGNAKIFWERGLAHPFPM
jgi:hypothetical protein